MQTAGYELLVYDKSQQALNRLSDKNIKIITSAQALASEVEIVLLCLPLPKIVADVVAEVAKGTAIKFVLDLSTTGPSVTHEIAAILKEKKIVSLGNGGVKSISDAYQICNKFGLDGILIGQAALGNPWAFKKDYTASKDEILDTILKHAKYVSEFYPPERFVTVLKHFGWYPKSFENCTKLKIELLKTRNYDEVEEVIAKFR